MQGTIKSSNNIGGKIKHFFKDEWKRTKKHKSILLFILPAFLLAFIFGYIPMTGILFSFKAQIRPQFWLHDLICEGCTLSYCGSKFDPSWTLSNYADIFKDEYFISAIKNTLEISLIRLVVIFPLTIVFAIMLSEIKSQRISKLVLIITCLPNFISWPVALGIWQNIFGEQTGMLNSVISAFHNNSLMQTIFNVTPDGFQAKQYFYDWYLFLVIFLSGWKSIGWGSIMYYATIVGIDKSYYEAATIDGATKVQKIRYLTIPSLLPIIALMLVMNITYILDAGFDQIYAMLKIVPSRTYTDQILGTYIFNLIQGSGDKGYPFIVALGVFNGLIALIFMLVGNTIVTKTLNRSLW